jgi:hypothetical protein
LGFANQLEPPMASLFCCRRCVVEIEPIGLADGTAALVCVACDVIGLAHEVAQGGPMWTAGLATDAPAAKRGRVLTGVRANARPAYG